MDFLIKIFTGLVFAWSSVFGGSHVSTTSNVPTTAAPVAEVSTTKPTSAPSPQPTPKTTASSTGSKLLVPAPAPAPVAQTAVANDIPKPLLSGSGTTTGAVIGYLWKAKPGSPKFATVYLPAWNELEKATLGIDGSQHEYNVYILQNDSLVFYQKARAVVDLVTFPEGGVSEFEVLGVNPDLGICATDRNVSWVVTFSASGQFDGTREAITTNTPLQKCMTSSDPSY